MAFNNKAAGMDNILAEYLKEDGDIAVETPLISATGFGRKRRYPKTGKMV